jgi:hypothetical protein
VELKSPARMTLFDGGQCPFGPCPRPLLAIGEVGRY